MNNEGIILKGEYGGGWITLNKPEAQNAITIEMLVAIKDHLQVWELDPLVKYVLIRGEGKVFSAGGDLIEIIEIVTSEQRSFEILAGFYLDYFNIFHVIHHFSKPYIAVIDGVSLGMGMNLSSLGSYRIITENTRLGIPEVLIGAIPPIESLKPCPGKIGLYLSLTGKIIGPQDALFTGLGTHYIPASEIDNFLLDIRKTKGGKIDEIIRKYQRIPEGKASLQVNQHIIDSCFDQPSIENIFKALAQNDTEFAAQTLSQLKNHSPIALRKTFEHYRESESKSIDEIIDNEIPMYSNWIMSSESLAEFQEGVRAMLIDKDKKPKWLSPPILY